MNKQKTKKQNADSMRLSISTCVVADFTFDVVRNAIS